MNIRQAPRRSGWAFGTTMGHRATTLAMAAVLTWGGAALGADRGWGLYAYDREGTRYYPFASQTNVQNCFFLSEWSCPVGYTAAYTGDVNADDKLELVIGNGTDVRIYDASYTLLRTISGAGSLNILDDITGDGHPEILVSDRIGTTCRIRAYDSNGSLVRTFSKNGASDSGMSAVAAVDLDKDGTLELVPFSVRQFRGSRSFMLHGA